MTTKKFSPHFAFCLLLILGLAGCAPYERATNWVDRQFTPTTVLNQKTPQPDTWCYRTMGAPDCYHEPLIGGEERLISVDPPSKYPQDRDSYRKAIAGEGAVSAP